MRSLPVDQHPPKDATIDELKDLVARQYAGVREARATMARLESTVAEYSRARVVIDRFEAMGVSFYRSARYDLAMKLLAKELGEEPLI